MNWRKFVSPIYRRTFPKRFCPEWFFTENYDSFINYWDDHKEEFPRVADVETTNMCNAKCPCCLHRKMHLNKNFRGFGIMSMERFKEVVEILKSHDVKIRGFYTTGEPLLDPTIFEKFAYAREQNVLADFVSLNTNVSLLTPEKYDKILKYTDNITLSFFNVEKEYERLTGGLSWENSYRNAINFIKYRDKHRPDYRIFIGCNLIRGSNLKAVKEVFKEYRVEWAIDAELRWDGSVITGVIDRAIMYPTFRCDGHLGALKIKWNGDVEACAYDFFQETHYANIFKDDWEEIRERFFTNWKKPFSLCARCDYWHLYWRVKKSGFKYVEDYSWQKPFLKEGEKPHR